MTAHSADRTVDIRDIDGPPFEDITTALDSLERDNELLVVVPFEPVPLYDVLETRGFAYESDQQSADLWHVRIERA
ncbi:DUF2249 domain-containing protein [Salinadaptatus halalkaliphilus]|uniref:DUF2249 domain-containing protein n=1 Tax=Salinadaptatus halalkaliphilus TaxID=2419781 RepID=A0A4S3TQY5_9EURY|nr:DUF2249 domain-containing protein [Salinadaptatus halalkaliphilus]THE64978.1 DUF2249 domain-containing protein [Salinadaptatus halalkaliphilus]